MKPHKELKEKFLEKYVPNGKENVFYTTIATHADHWLKVIEERDKALVEYLEHNKKADFVGVVLNPTQQMIYKNSVEKAKIHSYNQALSDLKHFITNEQ